ncbi:hypothetical protein [Streptomyces brevispora]|uniref:hypothetical protein n=1 Tax=Streptomyces brevispora TaxID=887462 RepID=UPI0035DEB5E0
MTTVLGPLFAVTVLSPQHGRFPRSNSSGEHNGLTSSEHEELAAAGEPPAAYRRPQAVTTFFEKETQ